MGKPGLWTHVIAAALCLSLAARALGDDPTTQPDPDAVRLTFLGDRLTSVEASIKAINHALVVAGYKQSVAAGQADTYRQGNDIMNRNGGGPVDWQDFYGRTARSFIVRDTTSAAAIGAGPNGIGIAAVTAQGAVQSIPRPPEFNYIYKANTDAVARAQSEVAALGNQIDALLARRRELEGEQSLLWATISFESIENRDIPLRPLYHYQLKVIASSTDDNRPDGPRLDVERALVLYLRTADHAVSVLEDRLTTDQQSAYRGLRDTLHPAQDTALVAAVSFADSPGVGTPDARMVADAAADVRRIQSLCKNMCDSYDLAVDGDRQSDEPRKQTFRGQLQDSLFAFAETIAHLDGSLVSMAGAWDIRGEVGKPSADTLPEPIVISPPPPPVAPAPAVTADSGARDAGGAVPTIIPQPPAPAPSDQANPAGDVYSQLTDKLNHIENWKITNGSWTGTPDGKLHGEGDSMIEFIPNLPADCSISFHMNVIKGMRPRIHFDGPNFYVGNEGYTKNIAVHGKAKNLLGNAFNYTNGEDIAVTVTFSGSSFVAQVGDQVTHGDCQDAQSVRLRVQAGDGWSKGVVEYSEFLVQPASSAKNDAGAVPITAPTVSAPVPVPGPVQDAPLMDAGVADSIDLLKMVDPIQDAVRDNWRFDGSSLLCLAGAGNEIVEFPYVPPAEYDFRVAFVRAGGTGAVTFVCDAGGRQIAWTLGGDNGATSGFCNVNGNHYDHNRTTRHTAPLISSAQPHIAVIKVRQDRIEAFLDDAQICALATNNVNFSLPKEFALHHNSALGVVGFKDALVIESAQVVEVSGHGHSAR